MNKFKTIGVLGGMGPCASAHFYQLLLSKAQQNYGAVQDNNYPHIIVNSLALEGSTEFGMEDSSYIANQLIDGINSLERAGVDFIVIACNSVHNNIARLRNAVSVPVISIIEEVMDKVIVNKSKKVLLLSSDTTCKDGLYNFLPTTGIKLIKPNVKMQKEVTKIVLSVMGGYDWSIYKTKVINKIDAMYRNKKIDSVILGCTELPIALRSDDTEAKLYDSLEILADVALQYAQKP